MKPDVKSEFYVECRGLPWETTDDSLKKFFGGKGITAVDIERMAGGRLTGDAVVYFDNETDYRNALKKHRETIGTRYVEVYSKDQPPPPRRRRDDDRGRDFDRGGRGDDRGGDRFRGSRDYRDRGPYDRRDGGRGDRDRGGYGGGDRRGGYGGGGGGGGAGSDAIIRLRGLPFSVNVRDVIDFFQPLRIIRDGVILPELGRMNSSGEAYVIFEHADSVQLAKQRHMKNIGHRYIEVFDSCYNDLARFCEENNLRVPRMGPSPFVSGPAAFSSPPQPHHNQGPYNGPIGPYNDYPQQPPADNYRGGPPRGEPEPQDPYGRGGPRNGPVPPAQSGGPGDYNSRNSYDGYPPGPQPPPGPQQQQSQYGLAVPMTGSGYYDSAHAKPAYDSFPRGPDPRDGHPTDPRYADYGGGQGFESRDPYASNWRGGNGMANGGNGNGGAPPPPPAAAGDPYNGGVGSWASNGASQGGAPPPGRGGGDGYGGGYGGDMYAQREGGGPMRRPDYGRVDDYNRRPEPYGGYDRRDRNEPPRAQHFVLRMRGIPFRAAEADVAHFFYPANPDQIELIRDATGRPSGDARVIFYNRKEYDTALMKDKQYMGERYIELIPDNGRY